MHVANVYSVSLQGILCLAGGSWALQLLEMSLVKTIEYLSLATPKTNEFDMLTPGPNL